MLSHYITMKKFIKAYSSFWWIVFIFFVSIGAMVARGYSFGTADQVIQLPLYYKLLDVSLFSTDALFPVTYSQYTVLYFFILTILRITQFSPEIVFFALYIVFNFLFFCGVFFFATGFTNNKTLALFSLLMFVWHIPIAGSAITTVESLLVPRFIALALSFFVLGFLIRRNYLRAFILLSVIFLIHPPSFILTAMVCVPYIFFSERKKALDIILLGIGVTAIIVFWYIPQFLNNLPHMPFFPDIELLSILKLRNTYAFPLLWSGRAWFNLIILLTPLGSGLIRCWIRKNYSYFDRMALTAFVISCMALTIQIIGTSFFPVNFIISLQLGRIWVFPIMFSLFYLAFYCSYIWHRYGFSSSMLGIIVILFFSMIIFVKWSVFYKMQPKDWIDVQLWSKEHTTPACAFLVDFYSQGFRVYSQRSIVGEYKDGTLSFYSDDFAKTWNTKRQFFNPKEHGEYVKDINILRTVYPFSFVVLNNAIQSSLNLVYRNASYTVYSIPAREEGCLLRL